MDAINLEYANGKLAYELVKCMHGQARMEDRYFDEKKYHWEIGIDIWERLCLHARYSIPFIIHQNIETPNYLMGIRVELDHERTKNLQLFKEIRV